MLVNLQNYFGPETIYLWLNFGIMPLWLALIFFPSSRFSLIFISSIFLPITFSTIYIYIAFQLILSGETIVQIFNLYLGIENLLVLFSNDNFLLIFWIHLISINLFLGSWVSKDATKYGFSKIITGFVLIVIYFTGPLGLVLYWFIRIFYARKISLHD
jgi:hypothetical protein|tara:strand:+ start:442 stop:915 length:474 start_codon:yes stop_codon:yes gene_type:complete